MRDKLCGWFYRFQRPGTFALQLFVTDDFGNLVQADHAQLRTTLYLGKI